MTTKSKRSPLRHLFRTALVVVPIGVLGNLAFSLLTTDRALLRSVASFPREYLLLAIALGLAPWITGSLRLLIWTRFLGYGLSFRETFRMTLANDLGAAISPTAVGGGFLKWGLMVQRGITPGAAASLAVLPTIEDGIFFAVALPVAVVLSSAWELPIFGQLVERFGDQTIPLVIAAAAALFILRIAVRMALSGALGRRVRRWGLRWTGRVRRKLRATLHDAREVFRLVRQRGKHRLALTLLLTAAGWICRYSVVSALIAFLGVPVDPVLFWVLQWVVFTLMSLMPTPGAVGGAEAAFFLIYSALVPGSILGLATAGWRFLTFYLQVGIGAVLFIALGTRGRTLRSRSHSSGGGMHGEPEHLARP